jgi:hypothetical protein
MTAPRGLRNNSPGNIEDGNFARSQPGYAGPEPPPGRFATFADMRHGLAALMSLLLVYRMQHGLTTVRGIINRWAPSTDGNDTSAYVQAVSAAIGVSPDTELPGTAETLVGLAGAIAGHENGKAAAEAAITEADYAGALAILGMQEQPVTVPAAPVPERAPVPAHHGGEGEIPEWPFTETAMPADQQQIPKRTLEGIVQDVASVIPEVGKLLLDTTLGVPMRNLQAATVLINKLVGATKPATVDPAAWNAQAMATAVVNDPLAAARARAAVLDEGDRILGMTVKATQSFDDSADRAAERTAKDPAIAAETDELIKWIMFIFAALLVGVVVMMGIQSWFNTDHEPSNALMVIFASLATGVLAIVTGIYAYRFGMKQGADAANAAIRAMQK